MTIRTSINAARLNEKLMLLEACCGDAPAGTYEDAKALREVLGDTADTFLKAVRALGFLAPNCDQIREVEAVLYGFVRDANPDPLAVTEGFGAAMGTDARERVIRQTAAERDSLQAFVKGKA